VAAAVVAVTAAISAIGKQEDKQQSFGIGRNANQGETMKPGKFDASLTIVAVVFLAMPLSLLAASRTVKNAVSQGNGLYYDADYSGAIAKYQTAIDEDAGYAPAWGNKALAHAKLGEFGQAETDIAQAIAVDADDARYLLNQGKILAMQGQYTNAVASFTMALALDGQYKQAFFNRGWCHDEIGDADLAAADYTAALDLDANYSRPMLGVALIEARLGNLAKSVWWCKRAACTARANDSDIYALARRNLRVVRGGDYSVMAENSITDYTTALSLLVRERSAEALVLSSALVTDEPDSAICHLLHSLVLQATGDDEGANTAYAAALDLLPAHSVDSMPGNLSLRLDFNTEGETPVDLPLFPAVYDLGVTDLPLVLQRIYESGPVASSVVLDMAEPETLSLAGLVAGSSVSNVLIASEQYSIRVDDLMNAIYALETGLIQDGDLSLYDLALASRTGFFASEGSLTRLTLASHSPNITVTAGEVSASGQALEFVTSSSFPLYPGQRDVTMDVTWETTVAEGAFVLRFLTPPVVPPVFEDFETDSIDSLANYWNFNSTIGTIEITSAYPYGGMRSLRMGHYADSNASGRFQDAILRVDLSSADNHVLDYRVARTGGTRSTASVAFSVDGSTWTTVHTLTGTPDYLHCAIDIDSLGLALDEEVFIRFRHDSRYAGYFQWDDIRLVAADEDVFGPHVVSVQPIQSADPGNPVTGLRIEFNENIDASTFTAADIDLIAPDGSTVAFASNPVDEGDGRTFTAPFSGDVPVAGVFFVTIGPLIYDLAGNLMDQDVNGVPGDAFSGSFTVSGGPGAFPFIEDFEQNPIATMSHWVFSAQAGEIVFSSAHGANGSTGLAFIMPTSSTLTRSAIARVGLDGQTAVTLDFMIRNFQGSGRIRVSLSVDGANWYQFADITTTSGWQHRVYDLDAIAASRGWTFSDDTRIRFVHSGNNTIFSLDDVRITTGLDLFGPSLNPYS
jgi:Tfp pilus assembly protein PilF